jgi:hypothetical protein
MLAHRRILPERSADFIYPNNGQQDPKFQKMQLRLLVKQGVRLSPPQRIIYQPFELRTFLAVGLNKAPRPGHQLK